MNANGVKKRETYAIWGSWVDVFWKVSKITEACLGLLRWTEMKKE